MLNVVFTLVWKCKVLATGEELDSAISLVHNWFSAFERRKRLQTIEKILSNVLFEMLEVEVQKFEALVEETFDAHEETGCFV